MNWEKVENLQQLLLMNPHEFSYKDPWFLREFIGLIIIFNPTALVETGTWKGGMIKFASTVFPNLKIFSCDIMPVDDVIKQYRNNPNVYIEQTNSKLFLHEFKDQNLVGQLPFFFLDAHAAMDKRMNPEGLDFNPLASELEELADCEKALICIHDFKVPNIPEFGHGSNFSVGGEKYRARIELDSIRDVLETLQYGMWFPFFPPRLLHTDKLNWRSLFDLRGRVYIIINPSKPDLTKMKVLEDFGVLWKYKG